MQSVSPSPSPPTGRLNRDLLAKNRRRVRGLTRRWSALSRSRTAGAEELASRVRQASAEYHHHLEQLRSSQRSDYESAITAWDTELDQHLSDAERRTLRNLVREQDELGKEATKHKAARSAEEAAFQQSKLDCMKRNEQAKQQVAKVRESGLSKIERERQVILQQMQEAREWIGVKSGNPNLGQQASQSAPARAAEISKIPTLDAIAREFEKVKQQIAHEMKKLQRHPSLRLTSMPVMTTLGIVSAIAAGGIGYAMQTVPLVWGASAFVAAVLVPLLTALLASPWITRTLKQLFPPIVELETEAEAILKLGQHRIQSHSIAETAKLDAELQTALQNLASEHRDRMQQIDASHERARLQIIGDSQRERQALANSRHSAMTAIDHRQGKRMAEMTAQQTETAKSLAKQHADELRTMRASFENSQRVATQLWQRAVTTVAKRVADQWQAVSTAFPEWSSPTMAKGTWPRSPDALAWPIGRLALDPNSYRNASAQSPNSGDGVLAPLPILFDLLHHGNLVIDADGDSRGAAQSIVRQMLLRSVSSLPAGAMHVTVIDPEGLGKEFSWLMHLADVDPQLVNHRAWTQPVHIAHQLELAARHVEDVIQQSLRNRFRDLADYNTQAGPMAIPFRCIVWSGFPLGLDEHSWQSLCALMASGGRCGVGVILRLAENCKWPAFADPAKLREHGMVIELRGSPTKAKLCHAGFENAPLELLDGPDDSQVRSIMEHQLEAAKQIGKRIVPFASIAPTDAQRSSAESAEGLEIPIGVSDSGRTQSMRLGTGTAQHVLIAGKTGSGKSSLLHTLITSSALRYPPDQLRMILLDFKKGVEFQIYAEQRLPHADIIGIESRREFGLSTLEYLDRILIARGEAFRQWGVQDLPNLKRKHPEVSMPRILIVIDEFQELFVEDDKLSQQVALLMDRLVRQGRSFGMHLVLASQTLGGAYSLPRTTLAQMAVRVALQCDSSDAMLILSEDNPAAERLRHSGQGIYNEAGGRIEGNQNFQVSFLEKAEQTQWLRSLGTHEIHVDAAINPLGKCIIFEGHKPSRWEAEGIREALENLPTSQRALAPWPLGESVSIEPPVVRTLARAAGRNAMIVSNDSGMVAGLMASWIRGSQGEDRDTQSQPRFWILNGSSPDDEAMSKTMDWARTLPARDSPVDVRVASARDVESMLDEAHTEWSRRHDNPDANHSPLVLMIANLSRFRELRRSDDFSYSSPGETLKPDAILTKLLAEGPPVGIHVCVWADTVATLTRWLPRNALRDIEVRILAQMSASDSNQLIDSSAANRLDRYVLLAHDDADGRSVKFRPYELDSVLEQD